MSFPGIPALKDAVYAKGCSGYLQQTGLYLDVDMNGKLRNKRFIGVGGFPSLIVG